MSEGERESEGERKRASLDARRLLREGARERKSLTRAADAEVCERYAGWRPSCPRSSAR